MTAQGDVLLDEIEWLRVVLQYVADAPTRVQACQAAGLTGGGGDG